ncbi:MAG TPA: hypothetical protein VFY04_01670 [Solirubrobacterales bacterium]|nr:hypothetical protein [Solirubrobacterales bacterium]
MGKLSKGERIASVSAILLFALMFFDWFDVKTINTSNLLSYFVGIESGKNAWEALYYISSVLGVTVFATLVVAAIRVTDLAHRSLVPLNALIAMLGLGSALLILFRIVDPPVFLVEPTFTYEGAVRFPMFFALLAAAGIAFGGCMAMREERSI